MDTTKLCIIDNIIIDCKINWAGRKLPLFQTGQKTNELFYFLHTRKFLNGKLFLTYGSSRLFCRYMETTFLIGGVINFQ